MSLGLLLLSACEAPTASLDEGPPEIRLFFLDQARDWHAISEGGNVPLYAGPEGGFLTFLGIDVINMVPEDLDLELTVQHPSLEEPLVRARMKSSTGKLSSWLCPLADVDVDGASIALSLTAIDIEGTSASKRVTVVPSCAEPQFEELCRCQCSARYPACAR